MEHQLLHAKDGFLAQTTDRRHMLLRKQLNSSYLIHLIRYVVEVTAPIADNESVAQALSIRDEDQRDDTTDVPVIDMVTVEGIFGVSNYQVDVLTTGALGFMSTDTIMFPAPYEVIQAAWLVNPKLSNTANIGVELWFERVGISAFDQALRTKRIGGRPRTE